jgi:hypothetical protein
MAQPARAISSGVALLAYAAATIDPALTPVMDWDAALVKDFKDAGVRDTPGETTAQRQTDSDLARPFRSPTLVHNSARALAGCPQLPRA